jgi:hypothetical protein
MVEMTRWCENAVRRVWKKSFKKVALFFTGTCTTLLGGIILCMDTTLGQAKSEAKQGLITYEYEYEYSTIDSGEAFKTRPSQPSLRRSVRVFPPPERESSELSTDGRYDVQTDRQAG